VAGFETECVRVRGEGMTDDPLVLLFLGFALAVGVGAYAASKGRSVLTWFLLSFLLTPVIAFVIVAVLGPWEDIQTLPHLSGLSWESKSRGDSVSILHTRFAKASTNNTVLALGS
jgi:uncharacterized membrane protein YcfT